MQPEEQKRTPLRLWVFVFAGIAAMMVLFFSVDARSITSQYTLYLYLGDAAGLERNAPVRVEGFEVGWVQDIRFHPHARVGNLESPRNFEVEIRIRRQFQQEIRGDSMASVQVAGLLGQSYLHVTRGFVGDPLRDKDTLAVSFAEESRLPQPEEILARLADILKCTQAAGTGDETESNEARVPGAIKEE